MKPRKTTARKVVCSLANCFLSIASWPFGTTFQVTGTAAIQYSRVLRVAAKAADGAPRLRPGRRDRTLSAGCLRVKPPKPFRGSDSLTRLVLRRLGTGRKPTAVAVGAIKRGLGLENSRAPSSPEWLSPPVAIHSTPAR